MPVEGDTTQRERHETLDSDDDDSGRPVCDRIPPGGVALGRKTFGRATMYAPKSRLTMIMVVRVA